MSLTNAPRIETDRLILRGPEKADAEAVIAFLRDPLRSEGFGHIPLRGDAWRWFTMNVGHWHWHGYGYFVIELKDTGEAAGICGIWNPETWPEPELGWVVFDAFEGKGIAREAAERARAWAYDDLGMTTLTSNIVPGNSRSAALAQRLGATYERTYHNENMGEDELWRHPGPEALA
ncbi:GNAT family N-acetyltransferase [Antarctobacter heliothermus]|uniref:Protein N-acetyltransferase, RimJ/RimL family n=1 Tax=Antarctobacter heliothermus TaxID=74033 RepID=A0A239CDH8_9RHOB|nr:GNAT family N-acetyltransferase [Antarctobacter heliothermus]SNS18140.1 Protein N-acetyltransferase, RimJ/RimL family [Antarctobacter heliothermus]